MKSFKTEIKWAILFSLLNIMWLFMEKKLGWHDKNIAQHSVYTMLIIIPTFVFYFLAIREKSQIYFNHKMNWRQGFISGLILSCFIAVLSPIVVYINAIAISPNFFSTMIKYSVEHKIMNEENAKHYFTVYNYMFLSAVGSISSGVIIAAIVSLFTKNKE
jgi:hypothetical protein